MQRLTRLQRQQLQYIGNMVNYHTFKGEVIEVDYYPCDPLVLNAKVKLTLFNGREVIKTISLSEISLSA